MTRALCLLLLIFVTTLTQAADKSYSVDFDYRNITNIPVQVYNIGNNSGLNSIGGVVRGQRAMSGVSFRPTGGFHITGWLGMSLLSEWQADGKAVASGVQYTRHQSFQFDSGLAMGATLGWDMIEGQRVHFHPKFSWFHTGLSGTRGTMSTDENGCSYDFSSFAAASGACPTLGGFASNGVVTLKSDFSETVFDLSAEVALDVGGELKSPLFSLLGGIEQKLYMLSGSVIYSVAGIPSDTEIFSVSNQKTTGFYTGVQFTLMPVTFGATYHVVSMNMLRVFMSVNFQ